MNLDSGNKKIEHYIDNHLILDGYQELALETAVYGDQDALVYTTMGLVGEAGEIANKLKKVLRGDKELTPNFELELAKEVGDVLWYIAALSNELGFTLSEIAKMNLIKLNKRRKENKIMGDGDNR